MRVCRKRGEKRTSQLQLAVEGDSDSPSEDDPESVVRTPPSKLERGKESLELIRER